jgi:rRNA maturation RNase YbeY
MINFESKNNFSLDQEDYYEMWLNQVAESEAYQLLDVLYIFCNDEDLLKINQDFLNHDTYTDIITFDHSFGKDICAEIHISIQRVKANANKFKISFEEELKRVMVHGILHCMNYKDHTAEEQQQMRTKENEKIKMFHVEQNE